MPSTIEILGLDELQHKLGRLGAISTLKPPMNKAVHRIHAETQTYPPPPKGSTYRRKHAGGLAGSWVARTEQKRQTLVGVVGASISYAPYVMGPKRQAWMHKGRWPTTDDIVDKQKHNIVNDFEKAIRKVIDD